MERTCLQIWRPRKEKNVLHRSINGLEIKDEYVKTCTTQFLNIELDFLWGCKSQTILRTVKTRWLACAHTCCCILRQLTARAHTCCCILRQLTACAHTCCCILRQLTACAHTCCCILRQLTACAHTCCCILRQLTACAQTADCMWSHLLLHPQTADSMWSIEVRRSTQTDQKYKVGHECK